MEKLRSLVLEKQEEIKDKILKAYEEHDDVDLFSIWLGNSMETPEPIRTKEDLKEALGY